MRKSDPPRFRCPSCGKYPTVTSLGTLRNHTYGWSHPQEGKPCPGSGLQVKALPGQLPLLPPDS